MPLFGEAAEVVGRYRVPVQMMHLKHGILDDVRIYGTVTRIGRLAVRQTIVLHW